MKLLIIGPSYKRRTDQEDMPAIERYDGVFYRVTRKNLNAKSPKILVLTENLQLVDASKKIPYKDPKGGMWNQCKMQDYNQKYIAKMLKENTKMLNSLFREKNIKEIFVAAGAIFRRALPDFKEFDCNIILPHGGLGPTAKSLKQWLQNI